VPNRQRITFPDKVYRWTQTHVFPEIQISVGSLRAEVFQPESSSLAESPPGHTFSLHHQLVPNRQRITFPDKLDARGKPIALVDDEKSLGGPRLTYSQRYRFR
jgi:hypothetical protein